MNGIWGTIAVGLFATNSAPGYSIADSKMCIRDSGYSETEAYKLIYKGGLTIKSTQDLTMPVSYTHL